jgi:hypothetical protein
MKAQTPKKMGRPTIYDTPRRPRLIQLSDELWEAIEAIAGEGKRTEYIEKHLRTIPEIVAYLEKR